METVMRGVENIIDQMTASIAGFLGGVAVLALCGLFVFATVGWAADRLRDMQAFWSRNRNSDPDKIN